MDIYQIFDTRDLIEYIEDEDNADDEEYASAKQLHDELEDYAEDFQYGATVIPDRDFQDYAQELAEDIGAIPENCSWPTRCIDWEQAARELQMDYSGIEIVESDGSRFSWWVR